MIAARAVWLASHPVKTTVPSAKNPPKAYPVTIRYLFLLCQRLSSGPTSFPFRLNTKVRRIASRMHIAAKFAVRNSGGSNDGVAAVSAKERNGKQEYETSVTTYSVMYKPLAKPFVARRCCRSRFRLYQQ